jgi:hypothetical protein
MLGITGWLFDDRRNSELVDTSFINLSWFHLVDWSFHALPINPFSSCFNDLNKDFLRCGIYTFSYSLIFSFTISHLYIVPVFLICVFYFLTINLSFSLL